MTRPSELIYAVDETPPPAVLVISALQHVAVIAVTLVFPLILGNEAKLSQVQFIDLLSFSMLAIGVATILLCIRWKFVGSGLLCPACYTAIFIGPSLFALERGGLSLVFGMTIVAGVVQVAIAPLLRRLRALMPSEIAGLVIAIVGPSLFALERGGLSLVFGMTIVAGVVQVAIAPLLRRLRALMPSEIAGLVIAIVGLALATLGVRY